MIIYYLHPEFRNPLDVQIILESIRESRPAQSKGRISKISYDGKTWIEIQELKNVRIVD
jgi:hypothetical protein